MDFTPYLDQMIYVLKQLPLSTTIGTMFLAFFIVYTLANKAVSMVLVMSGEIALAMNTRDELKILIEKNPDTIKVIENQIHSEFWHPILYMDQALRVATIIPEGLNQHRLIYPILLAYVVLGVYLTWVLVGKSRREKPQKLVPILSIVLLFAIAGGGFGLWGYLQEFQFLGIIGFGYILAFASALPYRITASLLVPNWARSPSLQRA